MHALKFQLVSCAVIFASSYLNAGDKAGGAAESTGIELHAFKQLQYNSLLADLRAISLVGQPPQIVYKSYYEGDLRTTTDIAVERDKNGRATKMTRE